MREVPFFLNIDEATSDSNGERVLTVLVSYFEKSIGMSIVDHYKSIECIEMNTEQILTKIDALFLGEEIPWENLISDLTDSAAYMKGKKRGLEVHLREKAPHLLDIGGYVSSHAQCCENFCSFFDKYIKKLWDDINRDINLSRDIDFASQKICLVLHTS